MAQFLNFKGDYEGLTAEQADESLNMYGYNVDSKLDEDGKGFSISSVFISLRFVALTAAAALMIIGGACGDAEGLIDMNGIAGGIALLVLTAVYCFLEIFKGKKSDEILRNIKKKTAMKFRVIRDSELTLLDRELLVNNDIIILQAGENVPADAYILEAQELTVDESLLTGDFTPADKLVGVDSKNEIKKSCIYSGTRILTGSVIARVTATGVDTKRYITQGEPQVMDYYYTDFENAINRITPFFAAVSAVMLAAYGIFSILGVAPDGNMTLIRLISEAFVPAIAFSLCFIPSAVASLVRIYYIYGAEKLAKKNSLVKDINALESLNGLTAICIDKAGAINKGVIEMVDQFSEDDKMMMNVAIFASDVKPTSPFDKAIVLACAFRHIDVKGLQQNELKKAYPFSEKYKLTGNLWDVGGSYLLCIKGSPENVFTLCNLSDTQLFEAQKKQSAFSREGHQVIAAAYAILPDNKIPEYIQDVRYTFAGLLAFSNRTRDSIPAAVRNCYRAGIKVIMTTGDSAETAIAIARKIGMTPGKVITGEELRRATDFGETISYDGVNIFARISADQKLDIVKALQDNGEIVAITGESASDVRVLRQADVGITISQYSSGAAYEAADLVMCDDNFNNLVDTLKESRQMHRNIKRCIAMCLSAVTVMAVFALVSALFGIFPFSPVLVLFITGLFVPLASMIFITNTSEMKSELTSSGFIGRGAMNKRFFIDALVRGGAMALLSLVLLPITGGNPDDGQLSSLFLLLLTGGMISIGWTCLSSERIALEAFSLRSKMLLPASGLMLLIPILLISIPGLNSLFGLSHVNVFLALLAIGLGIVSQLWMDIVKIRKRK